MIKIVIIEDEELLRKGLMYTVDWKSLDCVVIGEAANGKEGFDMIKLLAPDIVITDIKMPIMDGLEMIQSFEQRNFETIIITGFGEFEYAKKAIDLNVAHFILKPIDENKLAEIINHLRDKILDHRNYESMKQLLKRTEGIDLLSEPQYIQGRVYQSKYTEKIIDYVENHYKSRFLMEDLSAELGISSGYISKIFKEDTTFTFNDYLNRFRIQKSIELLYSGKYKLYEIADQTGFSEYKYYFHVFKTYMKCSPTEFLEANYYFKGESKRG